MIGKRPGSDREVTGKGQEEAAEWSSGVGVAQGEGGTGSNIKVVLYYPPVCMERGVVPGGVGERRALAEK